MTFRNTYSSLPLYSSLEDQNRFEEYVYKEVSRITVGLNFVPKFQWIVEKSWFPTGAKMVNVSTGVETDVFNELILTGLRSRQSQTDEFDIVEYSSDARLGADLFDTGVYYLKIENGAEVKYTEVFQMTTGESDLLQIKFQHNSKFCFPNGHFIYFDDSVLESFEHVLSFCAEMPFPTYEIEREVQKINGIEYPVQQVRKKKHIIKLVLAEHQVDFLSLVPLHDIVTIESNGKVHNADEFVITEINPLDLHDVAEVIIEFTSETTVVTNHKAVEPKTIDSTCYDTDYEVVALVEFGSAEYAGAYYIDAETSQQVQLQNDDRILVKETSGLQRVLLKGFANGLYYDISSLSGDLVKDLRTGFHYEYQNNAEGFTGNQLRAINGNLAYGSLITDSSITVEIWGNIGGSSQLIGTATSAEFTTWPGANFDYIHGLESVFIKVSNPKCGVFEDHSQTVIEVDFPCYVDLRSKLYFDDATAIADGVQIGQFYGLKRSNGFGWVERMVRYLGNAPFAFDSESDARAELGQGMCFVTTASNIYGVPKNMLMVTNGGSFGRYTTDAAAEAAGEKGFYVVDAGNLLSVPAGSVRKLNSSIIQQGFEFGL